MCAFTATLYDSDFSLLVCVFPSYSSLLLISQEMSQFNSLVLSSFSYPVHTVNVKAEKQLNVHNKVPVGKGLKAI